MLVRPRCRWVVRAVALAGALAVAPAAHAALQIQIGVDQRSGQYGECLPASSPCIYVQERWEPDPFATRPDGLPFSTGGVLTHIHAQFEKPIGTVTPRIVRNVGWDADQRSPIYAVQRSGPPLGLTGTGQLDAELHLPVGLGDTLALALSGGAHPFLDYDEGSGRPGHGELWHGTDSATELRGLKEDCLSGACNDGVVFEATLEPDADGDGFGDESQDQCPGHAGSADGCGAAPSAGPVAPVAKPVPVLTGIRHAHGVLTYSLTRPRRLVARLERGRHRHWRLNRRVRLPGSAGRHRIVLRSTRHRTTRVVLYGSAGRGRPVRLAILPWP
jgi:hypothetical protein